MSPRVVTHLSPDVVICIIEALMPVATGTSIGPFKVVSAIGAGGMGEVWRAYDPRIRRDVAIKVLPKEFAESTERLRRFEREAQAVGALNHPNLVTIHELGTHDGAPYIAMELLEGSSLRELLLGGRGAVPSSAGGGVAMPQRKAVELAIQFASGLAAAHERGLIHRDLKPENIFVTTDGRAKILDFGLVKLSTPFRDDNTASPTMPQTSPGIIVGTVGYMSPEQLSGEAVDHRSDIFALGSVLYEMLTGRRAFRASTPIETMKAILRDDPPPMSDDDSPRISLALERIVMRCLAKEPERRFQTVRDLIFSLEGVSDNAISSSSARSMRRLKLHQRAWLAGGALLGASLLFAGGMLIGWRSSRYEKESGQAYALRAQIPFDAAQQPRSVSDGAMALSSDGTRLAYLSTAGIVVRHLGKGESRLLEQTQQASFPFWSADGNWIAFFSAGKLKKIPASGGPVQILCAAVEGRGGSWGKDGTIVFAPGVHGPLMRVPSSGGTPTTVTALVGDEASHRNPSFLPDGKRFLFAARGEDQRQPWIIRMTTLDGTTSGTVLENAMNPRYADGHLFFVRDGNLLVQQFDPGSATVSGDLVSLTSGIEYFAHRNVANFSVSESGLVAFRQAWADLTQLTWIDRSGAVLDTIGEPAYMSDVRLSASGEFAVCVQSDANGLNRDAWTIDLGRKLSVRSTFVSSDDEVRVALSPDGKDLAYSNKGRTRVISTSGIPSREIDAEGIPQMLWDWSSDGRFLVLQSQGKATQYDFSFVALHDPSRVQKVPATSFNELGARLSPDGRWLAYQSNDTGQWEVYVTDFPSRTMTQRVSTSGGTAPFWSGTGNEIFYASANAIMAVPVHASGSSLRIDPPVKLPFGDSELLGSRAESPDGRRFLVLRRVGERKDTGFQLIVDWRKALTGPEEAEAN